jgi:hypothetical protein
MKKLLAVLLLLGAASADTVQDKVDWPAFLARHDLVWNVMPDKWDAGAFIGNGLLGAMLYADKDCALRADIGRSDVTDHRPGDNACFDKARLPIGHFVLKTVGKVKGGTMRLDLWNAETAGKLVTDRGEIAWRAFTHASELVTVFEFTASAGEQQFTWEWVAAKSASTRTRSPPKDYTPNPPAQLETAGAVQVCVQPMLAGGQYATAWQEQGAGTARRTVFVSVGNTQADNKARANAVNAVEGAAIAGAARLVESHRAWWHAFYPQSFLSIPDTRLESFYWIQIYKLASATRADRPALDLMGPWFRTTGWPAIWWNLNIQLSYYPVYTANHLELGESLCRLLDNNLTNLIQNVKPEWQHDSAAINRVTSYDCRGKVGNEVGNLIWTCQNYWRQCRYAADDVRLKERCLPLLRRCVNYYRHLLVTGDDGKLHLPPTYSPEYGTAPDCNYDLALLRWGCQTLLNEHERLKLDDPLLPEWKKILATLTDYPTSDKGLDIGRGVPLAHSHRHYSHLLMIYPLYLMNWEQPERRALIEKSLDHWIGFKGALQGYTYTGASSICASIGRRAQAVSLLNAFLDSYIKPNTMYLEGSPVIETPLSGAQSIQDLLLQSWGGKIRVFPGVPPSWKDATFHNLRAEGGFLVSAVRKEGKTQWVRVTHPKGGTCLVQLDETGLLMGARGDKWSVREPQPAVYKLTMGPGDNVWIYAGKESPPMVVSALPAEPARCNFYGVKTIAAKK